jgi:hypothetical protein
MIPPGYRFVSSLITPGGEERQPFRKLMRTPKPWG